jgi:hypothetical protein
VDRRRGAAGFGHDEPLWVPTAENRVARRTARMSFRWVGGGL